MLLQTRIRTLAAAASVALAVAALSVGPVHAEPKQGEDTGVRCAAYEPTTDEWEFYMPGETITVRDSQGVGHPVVCGEDGEWVRARQVPPTKVRPVLPRAGGVFAQR